MSWLRAFIDEFRLTAGVALASSVLSARLSHYLSWLLGPVEELAWLALGGLTAGLTLGGSELTSGLSDRVPWRLFFVGKCAWASLLVGVGANGCAAGWLFRERGGFGGTHPGAAGFGGGSPEEGLVHVVGVVEETHFGWDRVCWLLMG